jgi:hypothetical protein
MKQIFAVVKRCFRKLWLYKETGEWIVFVVKRMFILSQIFFNFRMLCVNVAVFRNLLEIILQYITKDDDTYIVYIPVLRKLENIWESVATYIFREKNF